MREPRERTPASSSGVGEFRVDEQHPSPGVAVVSVQGDADMHVAPELRDRLSGAVDGGVKHLVLDLSDTTFVDSMTLGVLLGSSKHLRDRGGELRLVVPRAEIRRIFEITLLDRIFPLHATLAEALVATGDESVSL